jgi:DNA-binding SARP family transcriptional activator
LLKEVAVTDKALYFFGPPQIVVDSENIKLSRKKAIALLAYLAVNDQSYSRDALAVLLWPESGQSQARAALRRTLSYLRTNLEEDWLEEGADLVVSLNRKADIWVDVVEFRNLVANSQLQECTHLSLNEIDRLQKATELYQGDFLAGFSLRDTPEYDEWQFFHAETLCQDLAKVLGCLVQAYANDHQFDQAITHVRRWLALDTLQEEVHRQLMLLYAWSGQRNAALRQYRICARTLADELGGDVKPTEETKKLYELVKIDRVPSLPNTNLDDSADVTAVPIPQRRWSRPLAGRQEEMAQLRTALKESLQGKGNLLLLSGEAGIGKTRLVLELARQAQSEGVLFLMGRAYEQDQGAPYRPWRELINTFISWASSEATSMAVAELGPELARLAPSLAEEPSPTTMTGPNPAQRFQFFEAVTQFFINISRQRLLLLFLDDIHWSEEASLQLLQYVAAKTRQEKILLIVAYRDVELEKRRKLWAIITQMNRERLFTLIHLARLPQGDVKEIIEYYLKGKVATELERIVYQKTDGNPFFVEELLLYLQREDALIRREEGWDIKAADTIQIPGAIGAVFEERLERFPQLLLDLLKWAAVIGTEFAFPLLQSVSGQSEDQLIEQIEVALAEKLIVERRIPGEEIFVFADEVIREVIYENISVIRRRRYHLLVGEAI